jgi:signal transduction histidine kinase
MLDRLEAAFQRQRQFTADASHELRTPLAMLRSQIDVALQRRRRGGEYEQILASLREDTERLSQMVGELLTLARADAGQEVLEREPVNLDELAIQVVAAMQPLAATRGVQLRHEAGPGPGAVVLGDQTRLMQLFVNLVDNGLKYTPAGGVVVVSVHADAERITVRVTDTGVGIAAEHLPHLFERFYRADAARARAEGGAGLGLAICQWIAHAHGGTIVIDSEAGRGTAVSVALPPATRVASDGTVPGDWLGCALAGERDGPSGRPKHHGHDPAT